MTVLPNWAPEEPAPKICKGLGCETQLRWYWRPGPQTGHRWRVGRWRSPEALLCPACVSANSERENKASKPAVWPPEEPPPAACTWPGCGVELPYTWRDGPWYGHLYKQGKWIPPNPDHTMCARHIAEMEAETEAKDLRSKVGACGLPLRLQALRWNTYQELRDKGASQGEFREFQGSLPPGTLGITPWNKGLAMRLRTMSTTNATVESTILMGPVGSGKSTLLAATVVGLIGRGVECRFITEAEIVSLVRSQWNQKTRKNTQSADLIDELIAVPVLALDDLGTVESPTDRYVNEIERLVCGRYDAGRPLLITTNVDLNGLSTMYEERVGSRLAEMTGRGQRYIHLDGPDWRTGNMRARVAVPESLGCNTCGKTPCVCACSECGRHPCMELASCR